MVRLFCAKSWTTMVTATAIMATATRTSRRVKPPLPPGLSIIPSSALHPLLRDRLHTGNHRTGDRIRFDPQPLSPAGKDNGPGLQSAVRVEDHDVPAVG